MTEAEWLASEDPRLMLEHLHGMPSFDGSEMWDVSDRKLRLVAQNLMFAMGVEVSGVGYPEIPGNWVYGWIGACVSKGERDHVAALLREIVGNPFRPTVTHKDLATHGVLDWNGNTVPRLATKIYDGQDWAAMPILADALMDAGCDDADVLAHLIGKRRCLGCLKRLHENCECKGTGWLPMGKPPAVGPHVRGCWALDLILGRE